MENSENQSNVAKLSVVPDPFDPSNLRLDQSFIETSGVKPLLTTVPVRKPGAQDFIRTHIDKDYRIVAAVIELKDDRETYLVLPHIAKQKSEECTPVTIFTGINRQGVLFLWPVKLPKSDGRVNEWHRSAMEAAERAMHCWLRVKANMSLGAYAMFAASSTIPGPILPTESLCDLLK